MNGEGLLYGVFADFGRVYAGRGIADVETALRLAEQLRFPAWVQVLNPDDVVLEGEEE